MRRGRELSFGDWADSDLENFSKPPFRAKKTHDVNERAMKHLRVVFETRRLTDLTADDIEAYVRDRPGERPEAGGGSTVSRAEGRGAAWTVERGVRGRTAAP